MTTPNEESGRLPETATTRLDILVAAKFGLSRRAAREAIRAGRVDLGDEACLEPGQGAIDAGVISFHPNRRAMGVEDRRVRVLFFDQDLLVVAKPAGILTHPTDDGERDTLLARCHRFLAKVGESPRIEVVHRLDKGTSGVVVFARTTRSHRDLLERFRRHDVERVYQAICLGNPTPECGTIEADLVRDRGDRRRGVAGPDDETGARAITHYELVERFGMRACLVRCRLETGRTHQIRIHLAEIGIPVFGDPVYGRKEPWTRPLGWRGGPALHAESLAFDHARTGERIDARMEMPEPMSALLERLRERPERKRR